MVVAVVSDLRKPRSGAMAGLVGLTLWCARVCDPCAYVGLRVHLRTARAGSHAIENALVALATAWIADWARTQ